MRKDSSIAQMGYQLIGKEMYILVADQFDSNI